MFGQNQNEVKKPVQGTVDGGAKPVEAKAEAKHMTDTEKKEARKTSAKKMLEHKKNAIKTLVEFAKRMNADGNDAAVKEAAEYLSGEKKSSAVAKISVLDQIFKDNKPVKAVDIFMNFEKGRSEMITLCKRAATKGIIIEYDEATKTYTKK
jgi:hypothetical protein|nr:MAG TPA: hypothetical protein [Caudoviricetes sp.]